MNKSILIVGLLLAVVFAGWYVIPRFNNQLPQKVTYHGCTYLLSSFGHNLPQIHLDYIKESKPTGELVYGLEVYQRRYVQTPTVLYLRQKDGTFKVYELSGGP